MQQSFVNSTYDRAAAVARARRSDGPAHFQRCSVAECQSLYALPPPVLGLIASVMMVAGGDCLPDLLAAIPQGATLLAVPALFVHWALVAETQEVPPDFAGFAELRAAALLHAQRQVRAALPLMTGAQKAGIAPVLRTPGGQASVSIAAMAAHALQWQAFGEDLAARQRYLPAKFLAKAYLGALLQSPGGMVLCIAGGFGGDLTPGVTTRVRDQAIACFAAAALADDLDIP